VRLGDAHLDSFRHDLETMWHNEVRVMKAALPIGDELPMAAAYSPAEHDEVTIERDFGPAHVGTCRSIDRALRLGEW
jgi:hypothetical protein